MGANSFHRVEKQHVAPGIDHWIIEARKCLQISSAAAQSTNHRQRTPSAAKQDRQHRTAGKYQPSTPPESTAPTLCTGSKNQSRCALTAHRVHNLCPHRHRNERITLTPRQ